MATHSDPHPIFVDPVKTVIQQTLEASGLFEALTVVKHEAIERDGSSGASIVVSKQIVPVINRTDERSSGGRSGFTFVDDAGNKWERVYRSALVVHFDVSMWFPDIARATQALFYLVSELPRGTWDQHLVVPVPVVNVITKRDGTPFEGNPIDLECISPQLPEERTSTARTYRSSVIVRAVGGIYADYQRTTQVTPRVVLANP